MRVARHTHVLAFLTLFTILCSVELVVARSTSFMLNPNLLSLAITADLVIGVPLLYYMLIVRTRRGPTLTLVPVFIGAVATAYLVLPPAGQTYLAYLEYVLPLIEVCLGMYGAYNIRRVVMQYRRVRPTAVYASDALLASLRHTFGDGRFVSLIVTELSIPFYLTAGWFMRYKNADPANVAFSCYRRSGYTGILGAFSFLIVVETIALHIIIGHWSMVAAWVLTALSVYSLVWLVGDYQAVRLHPVVLGAYTLHLRTGLRWRVDIPWTDVVAIRRATLGKQGGVEYLNMAASGEPRFVLELRHPVTVEGLFGIQRRARLVGLTVDDEALFERATAARMKG